MAMIWPCSVPMAAAWVLMAAVVLLLMAVVERGPAVVIWVSMGVMAFSCRGEDGCGLGGLAGGQGQQAWSGLHLTGDDGGDIRRIRAAGPPPPWLPFSGRGPCATRATVVNAAIDAILVMDFFMSFPRSCWFPRDARASLPMHGGCRTAARGNLRKHEVGEPEMCEKRRQLAATCSPAMAANCLAAN